MKIVFTLYYIPSRNSLFLSVINTKTTEELRVSSFSQKHGLKSFVQLTK